MTEPMMNDTVLDHVTSAAVIVYGLNLLKRFGWYQRLATRIPIENANVHRTISAVAAFVTAIGIHVATQGDASTGWHLAITVPPLAVLLHASWDWAQQFGLQQLMFDALSHKLDADAAVEAGTVGKRVDDAVVLAAGVAAADKSKAQV